MKSDAELVRATLSGDQEQFAVLVERHYPLVYGLALSSLRNRTDAEDVTQECFLRAIKSLDGLKDPSRFAAWLGSIVRNACRDWRARGMREEPLSDELIRVTRARQPEGEGDELHRLLWDQVMALAPDEREILLLYYFSKKNTRAIAELLDLSVAGSEKRLQRARQTLGARMEKALGDSIDRERPKSGVVDRTVRAVVGVPVLWKAVPSASASGVASVTTVLATWKGLAIVGSIVVSLLAGLVLLQASSVADGKAVESTERIGLGAPESRDDSDGFSAADEPQTVSTNFSIVSKTANTKPAIRVIENNDPSRPIAGAQVMLITDRNDVIRKRTNADGIAVFDEEYGRSARIKITHDVHLPLRYITADLKWNETQIVSMDASTTLRGRVVSAETGKPIMDFSILIDGDYQGVAPKWRRKFVALHDSDGKFDADGISDAKSVQVKGFGYAVASIPLTRSEEDFEREWVVSLESDYTLDLTVVDLHGNPISGVNFQYSGEAWDAVTDPETGFYVGNATDEAGKAKVEHFLARPYLVAVNDSRFLPFATTVPKDIEENVIPLKVTLERGGSIEGTISFGGQKIEGAQIQLARERNGNVFTMEANFRGVSGDAGIFRIEKMPVGVYGFLITLPDAEFASSYIPSMAGKIEIQDESITRMDFAVPAGAGNLSGRMTYRDEAVADARVVLQMIDQGAEYMWSTNTDAAGDYSFAGVLAGQAELLAMFSVQGADDSGQSNRRYRNIEIFNDQETIADADMDDGCLLTVHLSAPEEIKTSVTVRRETGESKPVMANAWCFGSRALQFEGLDPGSYEVSSYSESKDWPLREQRMKVKVIKEEETFVDVDFENAGETE